MSKEPEYEIKGHNKALTLSLLILIYFPTSTSRKLREYLLPLTNVLLRVFNKLSDGIQVDILSSCGSLVTDI